MKKFVKDKSANVLNFLAMNRIVSQFATPDEFTGSMPALNISNATFADFFNALNDAGASYMAIGHLAVAYHGYPMACANIELWLSSEEGNLSKIRQVLDFWIDLNMEEHPITYGGESFQLSTFTDLAYHSAIDFDKCFANSVKALVCDAEIPIIGLQDLIKEKMSKPCPENIKMLNILDPGI